MVTVDGGTVWADDGGGDEPQAAYDRALEAGDVAALAAVMGQIWAAAGSSAGRLVTAGPGWLSP